MEEGWVVSKDWVGYLFIALAYYAGSVFRKNRIKKSPHEGCFFVCGHELLSVLV